MKSLSVLLQTLPRLTAVAVASASFCATALAALPPFTLNPSAVSLNGATINGDNILVSDFSTIRFGAGDSFTANGLLPVSAFQLGGVTFTPTGLNTDYGLYIAFSGSGTSTVANPGTSPTFGTFSSLTYTLYGYNGSAMFGFDAANNPTETASGEIALASGSLINGTVSTIPSGDGVTYTPGANAKLTFAIASGEGGFFVAPDPFYNTILTAFTNTTSEVEPFGGGYRIRQGGGSLNFEATPAVPEPETYALMLAGLMSVGFMARRRRS